MKRNLGILLLAVAAIVAWSPPARASVQLNNTPVAVTVTPYCASSCTHTWTYIVAATVGGTDYPSAAVSTTAGKATLSTTDYLVIDWAPVPGASGYKVYRTASGGTPSTTGLVKSTTQTRIADAGLAGDSASAPTIDAGGYTGRWVSTASFATSSVTVTACTCVAVIETADSGKTAATTVTTLTNPSAQTVALPTAPWVRVRYTGYTSGDPQALLDSSAGTTVALGSLTAGANTFFAGPASGANASPGFRKSVLADYGAGATNGATLQTNGAVAAWGVAEYRLSSTASVNLNTATATTLYTCPSGKSCVVTRVAIRNASTSLTTASISFGWTSTAFADVIANATHTELTGSTLYTVLAAKTGSTVGAAAGTFKVLCNTLQGAAATATIDVFGYIY